MNTLTWFRMRRNARRLFLTSLALVLCSGSIHAQANFAGIQTAVTSIANDSVSGLAVDTAGDVFLCDSTANELDLSSMTGDAYAPLIPILSGWCASEHHSSQIASDNMGNVYLLAPDKVVKLTRTATGYVGPSIVASGLSTPTGVAVDPIGNVYIAESGTNRVLVVQFNGGSNYVLPPVVVMTGLSKLNSVAVDERGDVFASGGYGPGTGYVVKTLWQGNFFTAPTTILSGFNYLNGIAVDAIGNVFAVSDNNGVTRSNPTSPRQINAWEIPIVFGLPINSLPVYGSPIPVGGYLPNAQNVATDSAGNLYVSFTGGTGGSISSNVQKIQLHSASLGSVAIGTSIQLGVAFYINGGESSLPIASINGQGIGGFDFSTVGTLQCDPNAGVPFTTNDFPLYCTTTVKFAPSAPDIRNGGLTLYSASSGAARATVSLSALGTAPQVAFDPPTRTVLASPSKQFQGTAVDAHGNVYAADSLNNQVLKYPFTGSNYGSPIVVASGVTYPQSVAVDGFGNVFVGTGLGAQVFEVPWNGSSYGASTVVFPPAGGPYPGGIGPMVVDSYGNVFFCNGDAVSELPKLDIGYAQLENVVAAHGGQPGLDAVQGCTGLAIDPYRNLYVSDQGGNRIVKVPWGQSQYVGFGAAVGMYPAIYGYPGYGPPQTAVAGLNEPSGLAMDGAGSLYILSNGTQVLKAPPTSSGYGPAVPIASGFTSATEIAIDGQGGLYVSDATQNTLTKLGRSTPPSRVFLPSAVGHTSSDSPQTVAVSNIGNQNLKFTGLTYPKDFPQSLGDAAACASSTALLLGASCDLPIQFTPTVSGGLSEVVTITDNTLNVHGTHQQVKVSSAGAVPPPIITPPGGSFTSTQSLVMSDDTPGAAIYYTIDGTTPTTSSTFYRSPVLVLVNETAKAIAVVNGVSSSVRTATFTVYDQQVQVTLSASTITYPASTRVTISLLPGDSTAHASTGTVQLFLDGFQVTTLNLIGSGHGYANASYQVLKANAGTHRLYAVYSGDSRNLPGVSAVVNLSVLPAPVSLIPSCSASSLTYGANYSCKIFTTPVAAGNNTYITYRYDGNASISVPLSGGVAALKIATPIIGAHTVVVSFPRQGGPNGNYGPATPLERSFTVVGH